MFTRLPVWICLPFIAVSCLVTIACSVIPAHAAGAAADSGLTDQDRKLDCPGVRAAVADITVQIKRNAALLRKETATPPSSLAQMLQPGPPTAAALQAKTLRQRSGDLSRLSDSKGCSRLDVMARSRLGGAIGKPAKPLAERCEVRGELSLQDCAEDVAKWRCRAEAGKGRAYLVCLDQVAERVITASGYDVTTLAHYDPGCADATAPATCSIFASNRAGPDTRWCKRTSEISIDVCEPPKPGTPAITAVADNQTTAKPVAAKPAVLALPAGSTCRPMACQLGTSCNRLCGPPD